LIAVARTAARPDSVPAGRDTFSPAERGIALRILLRPSATLFAISVFSLVVATVALWTALAPWIGGWRATPATLAFAAAGALGVVAWRRRQPRVIEIGTDGIRAFSSGGARVANGPLTGCAQWGALLLVLVVGAGRSRRVLWVAADAVSAASFRELAVRARSAAGL
jgi:hypothetical protein